MEIFNSDFLEIDTHLIVDELNRNGYFSFERALSDDFISAVSNSIECNRFGINKNWITGVQMERQYYFTHMLAISKEFLAYVCHPKVLELSKQVLRKSVRLKAMRYYETQGGHHMQWHTDNKTDRAFSHIPGIIFVAYLIDVNDGEFQYVSGSHIWSGQKAYSDYSDEEIENNYNDKIVSFKKPKGSIIIYNTYGIHRANPVKNLNFLRKSLFFQVDGELGNAEPILLNPAFCTNLSKEIEQYLGFGLPADYEVFPDSDFKNQPLTFKVFIELINGLITWVGYRMARCSFDLAPRFIKDKIRESRNK